MEKRMQQSENKDSSVVVVLLRQLVAIELWKTGVSQTEIAKRLRVSKTTANMYLKGLKRTAS